MTNVIQAGLAICGLASLVMAFSHDRATRRWAPVVGLAGQPFWFLFALSTNAWGLMVTIAGFTAAYGFGIWKHWFALPAYLQPTAEEATDEHAAMAAHAELQVTVLLAAEIADIASTHAILSHCPFYVMGNYTWYDTARAGEGMVNAQGFDLVGDTDLLATVRRAVRYLDRRQVLHYHPQQKTLVRLKP